MVLTKEILLRLLNTALDGHVQAGNRDPQYLDGLKHVRELTDEEFSEIVSEEELDEFCVGIICSLQPAEPRYNVLLSELEKGILAAAYFLYTAMHPFPAPEVQSE